MTRHSAVVILALLLLVAIVASGLASSHLGATSLLAVSGDEFSPSTDEASCGCAACGCGGGTDDGPGVGLGNPAALYCERLGYEFKTVEGEDGEQGVCVLPDGEQVDAWAFYAGESGTEFSYCANMGWAVAVDGGGDAFAERCTSCVLPRAGSPRKAVSELLSFGELGQQTGLRVETAPADADDAYSLLEAGALPDHFDWRDKDGQDWMTPVKNQGSCGSCWAFSAVGVVEPEYNIAYGNPDLDLDLSEQYLVSDCCTSCGSCGGG